QANGLAMDSLEAIEHTVRAQLQSHVSPGLGKFFIQENCPEDGERPRRIVSILGDLWVSCNQAQTLSLKARVKHSPYLEKCCLRMCAKASYEHAESDVAMLTGVRVSAKTQERMVKRLTLPEPTSEEPVSELTLDGGMVRVRTPKGEASVWRQYHGIRVNGNGIGMAWYKDPATLLAWITTLPLVPVIYLLGDGHCGIWSLFEQMAIEGPTDEVLDWYHLKENLYKVDATEAVLESLSSQLWEGRLQQVLSCLSELDNESARRFSAYLSNHAGRIPNYRYYQMEGFPIGSGPVESWVKQIDARLQVTGAQWNEETLPLMLKLRAGYLNHQLDYFSSASG
ncbi:ISKra4 family transposase, partial [Okeania sp. SIO2B9]|uniref:ISKra4 family transposase n=1 Tax=Okeania sp. SIO2B9 TaxID=2607782 RepID=UPI001429E3D7